MQLDLTRRVKHGTANRKRNCSMRILHTSYKIYGRTCTKTSKFRCLHLSQMKVWTVHICFVQTANVSPSRIIPNKQMLRNILLVFVYLIGILALVYATDNFPGFYPEEYLEAHNAARMEVGVGNLTWDKTIEAYAENRTQKRVNDCKHILPVGPYGENLALFGGYTRGVDGVESWVAEKADYDYNSNSCAAGKECENYKQVVWQDTLRVGCFTERCRQGNLTGDSLTSCYYDPPGNVRGQRPYNRSAPTPPPSYAPYPAIIPEPNMGSRPNFRRKKHSGVVIGIEIGTSLLIVGFICFIILRWRRKRYENGQLYACPPNEFQIEMGPRMFSYHELATATRNFGEEERLGEGGFGAVYRGFLKNLNTFVAVKKISRQSKQGIKEYAAEIKIISRLRHRNTVKLIGWCPEKELMLVYEFMPNGSLDSHLFKGKSLLTWAVRYKIVQDVASALLYLHEEGDDCVLHRDIKSSNIMLDSDFNAKLGDFGLARLVDHAKGSQTTGFAGTLGYMAPECLTATSKASKKSDVYGFGVVALEIACGRRSVEHKYEEDQVSLVPWVWEAYGKRSHLETADKKLSMNFDIEQMECLMIVGLWCAHPDRNLRPCIRQVIQVLNFELSLPNLPPKMPIPKYDVPTASVITSSREPSLSLTVPR